MATEDNQEATGGAVDTNALDALAVETGVVEDTPEPQAENKPEQPAEEAPRPEGQPADELKDKPEDKPEDKKTPLQVVREQLAESREKTERDLKQAAEPKEKTASEIQAEAEPAQEKKDLLTKAEWAALPERAKARIGWLSNEVKKERAARTELEPRAAMFDEMAGFVTATGMSQDQFVEGLNIMGWLVTDPAKAYQALKPIYENLQSHMGELLPADLQEQVDDGRISPELAKELAFNRSQRSLLETKNTQRAQYEIDLANQRAAQEAQERTSLNVKKTIDSWQSRQLAADPDYRLKAAFISDRAYAMVKQEEPKTAEALLDLLDRAKGEVDKRIAGQQKRRELNPVTKTSAGGSINREPTTPLEAARMALAAMR